MYLNIGPLKTIKSEDVIGIFDLDTAVSTELAKEFLVNKEKNKLTISAGGDIPKSFVLTKDGKVYFSPYAVKILTKRAERKISF